MYAQYGDGRTKEGVHFQLRALQERSIAYFKSRHAMPSSQNYADAAQYLTEITELPISPSQAEDLLSLYPHVRIKLAEGDGVVGSDVREGLAFVAAHFFLGCTWPIYGDHVNLERFVSLLKQQAEAMGFPSIVLEQ